jgi:hypothetical protein
VRVAVLKLEGVESVEVSLRAARADVRLRRGNQLSLETFRQLVKNNGFTLKEIAATLQGAAREENGNVAIAVTGTDDVLHVAADGKEPAARKQLGDIVAAKKADSLEVVGVITTTGDATNEIAVTSVKEVR